jgi:fluoride exporter
MLLKLLYLAAAGDLGTVTRVGLAALVEKTFKASFPIGTLVVNISGCFAAGFLWSLFEHRWTVPPEMRTVVLMGFMRAFTTFSAFMLETHFLLKVSSWPLTMVNILLQNTMGLAALFGGVFLAARFI